jgi:hypothetical protein
MFRKTLSIHSKSLHGLLQNNETRSEAGLVIKQSGRLDSNQRPLRPERSALPGCATARKRVLTFSEVTTLDLSGRSRLNRDDHFTLSGRLDSNQRPPAPHAGTLPGCATSRMF